MDDLFEIPTGVLTSATPCFSPYCGKLNEEGYPLTCYSYSCPNKSKVRRDRLALTLDELGADDVPSAEPTSPAGEHALGPVAS